MIEALLKYKPLYKITGTPENFLTALRFKQWGFNNNNFEEWNKIETGDVVCFHCKKKDSFFIKNCPSCIIGFGIVGSLKFETSDLLWIEEITTNSLIYPFHFSFSEIVFFADINIDDTWDSQTLNKVEPTRNLIYKLLDKGIPLKNIPGFNPMGSFSILHQVNKSFILSANMFSVFDNEAENNNELKVDNLTRVTNVEETFRKATSLFVTGELKRKIYQGKKIISTTDSTLLERAENAHFETLDFAIKYFNEKGFDTYYNKHVDLFAIKKNTSYLIEVKSLENKNFRSQMRKGIAQLFEYNYFEVNEFKRGRNINNSNTDKLLITSKKPSQTHYIEFINSLKINMAIRENNSLVSIGNKINFKENF
jgi:hypothetical protein